MAKPVSRFVCQACGAVTLKWAGRCETCGEWNTVELVCLGQESIHIVNGKVVMRLSSPQRIDGPALTSVTSGPIILQSEGAELFYRDVAMRPIKAVPAEYRA